MSARSKTELLNPYSHGISKDRNFLNFTGIPAGYVRAVYVVTSVLDYTVICPDGKRCKEGVQLEEIEREYNIDH